MKMIRKCLVTSAFFLTAVATAGPRVGNGGGDWACREKNQALRWIRLVDLFEATNEFGLGPAHYVGTVPHILDSALKTVLKADSNLAKGISSYLKRLNNLEPKNKEIIHTTGRKIANKYRITRVYILNQALTINLFC